MYEFALKTCKKTHGRACDTQVTASKKFIRAAWLDEEIIHNGTFGTIEPESETSVTKPTRGS